MSVDKPAVDETKISESKDEQKISNNLDENKRSEINDNDMNKKREPFMYETEYDDEKTHLFKKYDDIMIKFNIIKELQLKGQLFECEILINELKTYINSTYQDNELETLITALNNHPRIQQILKELKLIKHVLHLMTVSGKDSPWKTFK